MKIRLVMATALAGALLASLSGAEAAPTALDGKKIKSISKTVKPGAMQAVDADETVCGPAECLSLPFVYKPAKGVKGGLMFTTAWTNPVSDMDMYIFEVNPKNKSETEVAHCAAGPGTKERVYLAPKTLRVGRTYRMVVVYFLSVNETVNAKVEINVPSTVPTTVPADVDAETATNCSL